MPGTKRGFERFGVIRFVGARFAGHDGAEEKDDRYGEVVVELHVFVVAEQAVHE